MASENGHTSVEVGGKTVELVLPNSFALRHEIALGGATNWQRAIMAALGMCWKGPGRPKARYEATYDPMAYGGAVLDELVARGLRPADLWAPAAAAFHLIGASLIPESEVAAAENFSAPPPGDSTP